MKTKHYFLIAAVGMFTMSAGSALAFHGGGVAHCDGCHSMHASADNPVTGTANEALLKGSDASSTCLNCHQGSAGGYHIKTLDGGTMSNGGDFYWVLNGYSETVRGIVLNYAGDNAGHNVVATDFGMGMDVTNATAPGGTYDSSLLGCTSCHDAHGQKLDGTAGAQLPIGASGSYSAAADAGTIKGNYRLLGDNLYEAGHAVNDGFDFTYDAPIALANGSNGAQVRYGSGMSEWCANCHADFFNDNPDIDAGKHPTSVPLATLGYDANYNSYVKTGDFSGSQATAFDGLVPFETGTTNQDDLITAGVASTAGPAAGAEVMCLSCHRSHASSFNNMGRWDFEAEVLTDSAVLTAATVPATAKAYYADGVQVDVATKYGEHQRSLCNKCHVQD